MLTLRLLRVLSIPNLRAHPTRTLVTIVGVAVGVAAFVGIAAANRAVIASFEEGLQTIAGESEIEVDPLAGALPEDSVIRAADVAGVAAAAGMLETFLPLADESGDSVYLLGIDFLGSPVWRAQFPRSALDIPDEIAFLSQTDSVVVTRGFAARRGLDLDSALRLTTPLGPRILHVRGLLDDVDAARLFGGALAIMDLPAAMQQLGRDGQVDRILVTLASGAERADVRRRLAAALGPGADVTAPDARGEQAEQLLASLRAMLSTSSFLALIVGAFIVYHTVAVAVGQRRRQFALANAVGISRRSLRRVCVAETLAFGIVGAGLGIALGRGLAALAAPLIGAAASEIWLRVDVAAHAQSWWEIGLAAVMGLAVTLVAGGLAIRSTFRAPTIEALRPVDVGEAGVRGWTIAVGLAGLALGGGLALLSPGVSTSLLVGAIDAVDAAAIAGAACLAPGLVIALGAAVHRLTNGLRSVPLRLAAIHLPRSPVHAGATTATVAAALAIATALAVLVVSFQSAWLQWIEQHFAADLFVGGGTRVRLIAGPPMAADVSARVRGVEGVTSVEPFRVLTLQLAGRPVFLQGISLRDRLAHGGLAMVEGTLAAAAPDLEAGTGVLVSDNLAYRLGVHRGDPLALPTPDGLLSVRVVGTFVDFLGSLDLGSVAVADGVLRERWHDDGANLLRVWLAPGAIPDEVRRRVGARLGTGYYVLTGRSFVDGIQAVLDRFFRAAWFLMFVSAFVGVIGIVSTQVASMLDRTRANATLHTIGIPVRAIARGVLVECALLGALGAALGIAVGIVLGGDLLTWSLRLLTGWRIPLRLPLGQLTFGALVATLVSAIAGWVPARAATRFGLGTRSID